MLTGFLLTKLCGSRLFLVGSRSSAAGKMAPACLSLGLKGSFWVCCSFPCWERINTFRRCGQLSLALLFPLGKKRAAQLQCWEPRAPMPVCLGAAERSLNHVVEQSAKWGRKEYHAWRADVFLWENKRVSILSLLVQPGHCVAKGV